MTDTCKILSEAQIDEHIAAFTGLLESGEYRQLVMENDEAEDDLGFNNESLDEYIARINSPNNYDYILNRCRSLEGASEVL